MGVTLFKILVASMILPFWTTILGGIDYPDDLVYMLFVLFGSGISVVFHEVIYSYLGLQKVFLTRILGVSILMGAFLYLCESLIPGFAMDKVIIPEISFNGYTLEQFTLESYLLIGVLAVLSGITYYSIEKLRSS